MRDVLDRFFVQLQKILKYDVSHQLAIVHNLSYADSKLTNRRENARFWMRKQIWEDSDMVMYTRVCG